MGECSLVQNKRSRGSSNLGPSTATKHESLWRYRGLPWEIMRRLGRGVINSLQIPIWNQKCRTFKPEIPLKYRKSRTLIVEVIYPSDRVVATEQTWKLRTKVLDVGWSSFIRDERPCLRRGGGIGVLIYHLSMGDGVIFNISPISRGNFWYISYLPSPIALLPSPKWASPA